MNFRLIAVVVFFFLIVTISSLTVFSFLKGDVKIFMSALKTSLT